MEGRKEMIQGRLSGSYRAYVLNTLPGDEGNGGEEEKENYLFSNNNSKNNIHIIFKPTNNYIHT